MKPEGTEAHTTITCSWPIMTVARGTVILHCLGAVSWLTRGQLMPVTKKYCHCNYFQNCTFEDRPGPVLLKKNGPVTLRPSVCGRGRK